MLLMPCPENVHIKGARMVDGDLYNIAQRIKELDKRLFIVFHEGAPRPFVVMEHCVDDEMRQVKRYERLDASIMDDLRYMLAVPFEHRLAAADARVTAHNAALTAPDAERQDRMLTEMDREMRRCNLYDPIWSTSYPLVPGKKRRLAQ